MQNELLARLNDNIGNLSKGHKKIAEYISSHYDFKAGLYRGSKRINGGALCHGAWL